MFTGIPLFTLCCDTTIKVAQREQRIRKQLILGYGLLHSFGKEMITEEMARNAERFLL